MAVDQNNPQLLLPPPPFPSHSDFPLPHKSTVSGSSTATTNMPNPLREEEEEEQVSCGSPSSGSFLTESVETGDGTELDEEDDYVSELTRRMARYIFQEDDEHSDKKIWGLSGSPQSAISGWDTAKLYHEEHKLMSSVAAKNTNQALTDYQIRAIQFYKLKQEQVARKQSQGSGRQNGTRNPPKLQQNKENPKPSSSPNPWSNPGPAHQHYPKSNQLQPPGSGMRAVFLGGSGSRTRSCGTGVFLPRGDRSNTSESRKKTGCSTVLIPARVAQALKLHFEQVGVVSRANTNNFVGNASDSLMQHDVGKNQDHKWHFETVPASKNHQYEMGLPQEWTY